MILGYTLSGNSSNEAMFFKGDEPSGIVCPQCGTCLNYEYSPLSVDIHPSKKYDISYTHDLRKLFSERFVSFCKEVLNSHETFVPVQAGKMQLFYMIPTRVVEFDVIRRKVRFEKPCVHCGGYEAIAGAHPAFLKDNRIIEPGFFRTDIPFGSGKSKFPLIVVCEEWKNLLASEKFRGIDFGVISN